MVALGSLGHDFAPRGLPDLRDYARWLPDVPNKALSLNERSFLSITSQPPGKYESLAVLLYGGSRGAHLSKLTMISVWIGIDMQIPGIYFTYSVEVDGHRVHTLGRRWPFGEGKKYEHCNCFSTTDNYWVYDFLGDNRIDFPIDGPRGEVINGVHLPTMKKKWIRGISGAFAFYLQRPLCSILTKMT